MTKPKVDATQNMDVSHQAGKTYTSPQLLIYGTITQVTRSVGKTGPADGGKGASMNKASA
jgi:hypothetical protein